MFDEIDIKENDLHTMYPESLRILLKDRTRIHRLRQQSPELDENKITESESNIIWATDDYSSNGEGYTFFEPILIEKIINENGLIIRPRCKKSIEEQNKRVKDKAEVFTPSWICNKQNNSIDESWFKRKDVFNKEYTTPNGKQCWKATPTITNFPENKTWMDYVKDTRLEITCGEAPYLCSRYDTTNGEKIPVKNRIGLLDRKLRIISENCNTSQEWLQMAQVAYKNIYGFEWQGDNLLLARESLLCTFIEYYQEKFHKMPIKRSVNTIANIISWNLWQMDGIKLVIPRSCEQVYENTLFGEKPIKANCPGCNNGTIKDHIGIPCIIKNWNKTKGKQEVLFSTLIH